MSLNGLFQTGRRSLRVLEGAIQTAGQNIANAETPGYSRQRLSIRSDNVVAYGIHARTGRGTFTGTGVSIQSYERVRDGLLDRAARDAHADLGAADQEIRTGRALEGMLAADTDGSLTQTLTKFWDAWGEVANAPADRSVRGVLLDRADALAGVFHRHSDDLSRLAGETRTALSDGVAQFNGLAEKVARLNERISAARAAGTPDFAAEDDRDQALQSLSALAPVRVAAEADGSYSVTVQGMSVVQGTHVSGLTLAPAESPDADDAVRFAGTDVAFKPGTEGNGGIGGWLRTLNGHIRGTRDGLDALAQQVAEGVNAAHRGGYGLHDADPAGLGGGAGRNFFDPSGVTAATFARSAEVDNPDDVALSAEAGARGDATVALRLADVRAGTERDAAAIAGQVGQRVQTATARSAAASALVGHFEGLAEGVSGVSLDEEMTHLIEYQQAYAASARVLTTAQSMFDTLLAI